jgi:hypothetical protein
VQNLQPMSSLSPQVCRESGRLVVPLPQRALEETVKVGDIVHIKWSSSNHWREIEIVGETSRSWLVLPPGSSDYKKDPTHWRWPQYCEKLPKCGRKGDDIWVVGSALDQQQSSWMLLNHDSVERELRWGKFRYTPRKLYEIALILEMDIAKNFPLEDTNAKSNQSHGVEVADGDRGSKA